MNSHDSTGYFTLSSVIGLHVTLLICFLPPNQNDKFHAGKEIVFLFWYLEMYHIIFWFQFSFLQYDQSYFLTGSLNLWNILLSTISNCHQDIHKCWHICHLGKGINFLLWHLISWNISLPSSQSKYYICTRTEIHSIFIIPICHSVPILIHIRRKYSPKLLYEEEWPREIYHSSMTCKKKFAGLEKENWKLFPLLLSCSSFQMAGTELFGKQWRGNISDPSELT